MFQDHDDYFQNNVPAEKSSFLYDAIVLLGTCANRIKKNIIETTNETITTTLLSSTTFREDIRTYNFTGASGFVDWYNCKYKSNRCNEPIQFGIFNIKSIRVVDDDTTMHTYEAVLTAKHDEDQQMAKDQRQHIQRWDYEPSIPYTRQENGMLIIFQREHGFLVLFSLPYRYVVSYVMRVSCF